MIVVSKFKKKLRRDDDFPTHSMSDDEKAYDFDLLKKLRNGGKKIAMLCMLFCGIC